MHTGELLTQLRTRGVTLYPTSEGIRYEAPRGALTAELRAAVAAHKAELLAMLNPMPNAGRLDLTDCLALIHEAFEAVAANYADGALALLHADPDLCRRFHDTEAAIDAAVKAGPTEAELRAALAGHVTVIREACQQRRAQREAALETGD